MQKNLSIKNLKFWTGAENYEENNSIPEDKVFNVQNARFSKKIISSRPGEQKLGQLLSGGTKDMGMFEYLYFDGSTTTSKAIRFYGGVFYEFNEATQLWTNILTGWPNIENKPIDGVNYGNALYVVGQTNKNGNGVGKIFSGINFDFSVSGVSAIPDANTVYQNNGTQFVVVTTSIIAGSGTITLKRLINTGDPTPSGTLVKVGGGTIGDTNITFSGWTKTSAPVTNFTVIKNSPEGVGIEAFVERLVVIGDPSFVGQIIMSQPTTSPATYYKVENFDTTSGANVFSAAKFSNLTSVRAINNNIYYWSQSTLYEHTPTDIGNGDNPKELSRTGGALNQKSTIVVENDVWFFSPLNEIRSLGNERNLGENPRTKALSEIIKSSMSLLDPVQDNPVMSYHRRIVKLHLKTKESPTNNFTIVFDNNTGGFSIDRGQGVNVVSQYATGLIYGQDPTGQAFRDNIGYSAAGATILFKFDTAFFDDSRPDTFKRARYVYIRGKRSLYQTIILKLYRDGNYTTYTSYTLPSPINDGSSIVTNTSNGQWGESQWGDSLWGGDGSVTEDIQLYRLEELISVQQRSNLFAIGIEAQVNGGKVEIEQLGLKYIPENENYKRSNI